MARARTEIPATVCAVASEENMAATLRNHAFIHNDIVNKNSRKILCIKALLVSPPQLNQNIKGTYKN